MGAQSWALLDVLQRMPPLDFFPQPMLKFEATRCCDNPAGSIPGLENASTVG